MNLSQRLMARRFRAGDPDEMGGGNVTEDRGDDFEPTYEPDEGEFAGKDARREAPVREDRLQKNMDAVTDGDTGKPADKAAAKSDASDAGTLDDLADTPEPEDEPGAKRSQVKAGKPVPLDRHEAILAKARQERDELQRQLEQYQNSARVAQANDQLDKFDEAILALEEQHNTALSEGDMAKARDLAKEIRLKEREANNARMAQEIAVAEARAAERVRYDTTLDRVKEQFPQLDGNSDEYDADAEQDVTDMARAALGRGLTPAQALQYAVKRVFKGEITTKAQKSAVETKARVTEADVAEELGKDRKKAAVANTMDAVTRQPPSTKNLGQDSDAAGGGMTHRTVGRLSSTEFNKLSERDKARLRGDSL